MTKVTVMMMMMMMMMIMMVTMIMSASNWLKYIFNNRAPITSTLQSGLLLLRRDSKHINNCQFSQDTNNALHQANFNTNRVYFLDFIVFAVANFNSASLTSSTDNISQGSLSSCFTPISIHLFVTVAT